ncbi:MAG: glycosyltransferase family 4 protein [Spirochaetes bacterium]|nr:glycosyltransferase family 4 protein [Spirochaetota bacterium]
MKDKRCLNIAVDCFPLSDEKYTGIPLVVLNILTEIQKIDKINNYYLLFKSKNKAFHVTNNKWHVIEKFKIRILINNFFYEKIQKSTGSKSLIRVFKILKILIDLVFFSIYQLFLPFWLIYKNIDIYIATSSDYLIPCFFRRPKTILFVYDLVWKLFPETMEWQNRIKMMIFAKKNIKNAYHLVSISESTKHDLITTLKIFKPVTTIHLAANEKNYYRASKKKIEEVKMKYNIKGKYILSVCTIEPRKNLISLLKAFSVLKMKGYSLVLTGKVGWQQAIFYKSISELNINDKIIITGYIPDVDLAPLYSGAEVFVYPSIYEGFGLPVLEAMQSGCPVITSCFSALPEVAGDAAITIDTRDFMKLANAIEKVLKNDRLRKKMRRLGMQRAKQFSWRKTAESLLNVIRSF